MANLLRNCSGFPAILVTVVGCFSYQWQATYTLTISACSRGLNPYIASLYLEIPKRDSRFGSWLRVMLFLAARARVLNVAVYRALVVKNLSWRFV
jgi:hypothetical protein